MHRKRRRIVLIVDNCPAHPDVDNLKAIRPVFLPPNTTSKTQPMDQGVINNLKVHYRKQLMTKFIKAIDKEESVSITVLDAMQHLRQAWDCVQPQTINKCYLHAGFKISDQTNTQDDDDSDPEDDVPLATPVVNNITLAQYASMDDDLVTSCPASEQDIVQNIIDSRTRTQLLSDDEDEDEVPPPLPPTLDATTAALEIVGRYVISQDDGDSVMTGYNMVANFVTEKEMKKCFTKRQSLMTSFVE
ncbi:tigger transposable element-derived protein 4-like [Haliotis rubra]|uniref:tigger transposable element-derived protein 4-like n=1 Tax=Haliotis rubra TaxID=36100 RepID=UPI001EE5EB15|nr:tigger transposable element-derived protein 4-like [Haliotis rubra]